MLAHPGMAVAVVVFVGLLEFVVVFVVVVGGKDRKSLCSEVTHIDKMED